MRKRADFLCREYSENGHKTATSLDLYVECKLRLCLCLISTVCYMTQSVPSLAADLGINFPFNLVHCATDEIKAEYSKIRVYRVF